MALFILRARIVSLYREGRPTIGGCGSAVPKTGEQLFLRMTGFVTTIDRFRTVNTFGRVSSCF